MATKKQITEKSRKRTRVAVKRSSEAVLSELTPAEAGELGLLSTYHDQIYQLETVLTTLRDRLQLLTAALNSTRDSQAEFTEFFENTPAAYLIHDEKGQISCGNRAAEQLLGATRAQFHTRPVAGFMERKDVPLWLEHMRRCSATLRLCSVQLRLYTSRRMIPAEVLTLPGVAKFGRTPARFYTLILDATQRRATEVALAETQRDYHQLIDSIEGIVWEADAETLQITFVSRYAERLLGYPLSEWNRQRFRESQIFYEDRERVLNEIARAAALGQNCTLEYRVVTASRQTRWLHDNISVLKHGGHTKLQGVAVDVTTRHHAEAQLRSAHRELENRVAERTAELREKVGELEAFSYSISHDLRSPLRAMIGFATLALEEADTGDSARVKDYLVRIKSGAERADRLIQDVLSYSRLSRADMPIRPVDLDNLVQQLIAQSVELQPPGAEVEIVRPLRRVMGHEAALSQGILNILNNATKFVAPGTTPKIKIWAELVDGRVRVWFEDNGIGIAPSNLGRIFNIFERVHSNAQYPGTGIGLAVVRKAIERLGGTVGVESKPGQGSRFWFELRDGVQNEKNSASNRG